MNELAEAKWQWVQGQISGDDFLERVRQLAQTEEGGIGSRTLRPIFLTPAMNA
jgi:hypothetical protein